MALTKDFGDAFAFGSCFLQHNEHNKKVTKAKICFTLLIAYKSIFIMTEIIVCGIIGVNVKVTDHIWVFSVQLYVDVRFSDYMINTVSLFRILHLQLFIFVCYYMLT